MVTYNVVNVRFEAGIIADSVRINTSMLILMLLYATKPVTKLHSIKGVYYLNSIYIIVTNKMIL